LGHDAGEVGQRARDLLSRPPYREHRDGPVTDVLRRIRDLLAELLDRLLSPLAGNTAVAWTVAIAGTALLVALVWRWTRGVSGERRVALAVPSQPRRSADDWVRDAGTHADAGRWREALRCWYAATVSALLEGGVVEELPGRTVAELDAELAAADPALAGPVAAAGRRFEDVWYGHLEAGPSEVEEVAARYREVVRSLDGSGRRRAPTGVAAEPAGRP